MNIDSALKKIKNLDEKVQKCAEKEFLELRKLDKNIEVEIFQSNFVKYKLSNDNIFFVTPHNGNSLLNGIEVKQNKTERFKEEDSYTFNLYLPLFLENGGTFFNTFVSRYLVDLNRPKEKAILQYDSKEGNNLKNIYSDTEIKQIIKKLAKCYTEFYSTLKEELGSKGMYGSFLFSGHSMCDRKNRGDFCIIYQEDTEGILLKHILQKEGLKNIKINDPFKYETGFLRKFADNYVQESLEFEINKKLYLNNNQDFKSTQKKMINALNTYIKEQRKELEYF